MQRRHHYEHAFEAFLRARRIPYVAVDEARKALLPDSARFRLGPPDADPAEHALKSFDFVLYGDPNLLVEIKGRKVARPRTRPPAAVGTQRALYAPSATAQPERRARLENWATREDVESLSAWETLFGDGFEAVFVFLYWCDTLPPAALFEEVFEHRDRWYALRAVRVRDYRAHMKVRSPRWGTVHLPPARFDEFARPLAPPPGRDALPGDLLPAFATHG